MELSLSLAVSFCVPDACGGSQGHQGGWPVVDLQSMLVCTEELREPSFENAAWACWPSLSKASGLQGLFRSLRSLRSESRSSNMRYAP